MELNESLASVEAEAEAIIEEAQLEVPAEVEEVAKPVQVEPGYMTKEEWVKKGKDPKDYVDYDEWKRRGPIFDQIKEQKELIKSLIDRQTKAEYQREMERKAAEEAGYKKALEDVVKAHREAVEIGDADAANKHALEMAEMVSKKPVASEIPPAVPQAVLDFTRNKLKIDTQNFTPESFAIWQYAVAESMQMDQNEPNRSYLDKMAELELKVKDMFPRYYSKYETVQKKGPVLASSKETSKAASDDGFDDLDPIQQLIFRETAEAHEQRTGKKYTVKQYKKAAGLT